MLGLAFWLSDVTCFQLLLSFFRCPSVEDEHTPQQPIRNDAYTTSKRHEKISTRHERTQYTPQKKLTHWAFLPNLVESERFKPIKRPQIVLEGSIDSTQYLLEGNTQ